MDGFKEENENILIDLDQKNKELREEKKIQERLQSKAEILEKRLKDEEIVRSEQLHKERQFLEKKLEDMSNKHQGLSYNSTEIIIFHYNLKNLI